MKKTQTKAFANLVASVILLVFEIWAYVQTLGFKVVKKAAVQPATFPQVMCIGMMVFTIILLVQSLISLKKMDPDDPNIQPAASINVLKNKGVQAGLFVIALCILYVALFKTLGYVLASAIIAADTLENLDEEDDQLISFNEKLAGQIRMYVDQEDLWSLVYDGLTGTDAVG